jgi:hypothetical protein
MYEAHSKQQFERYQLARTHFIKYPDALVELEEYTMKILESFLEACKVEIVEDYNEASYLHPFWKNYPPEERGRQPRGDQYPWIEVGEHVLSPKLGRFLGARYPTRDCGIPSGPDARFVIKAENIQKITGVTDACWIFVDIKSVGPRDEFDHAVMSHNQISGSGIWLNPEDGVKNEVMIAKGRSATHEFHCATPPLYILSDGTICPVVHFVLKPIYTMLGLDAAAQSKGQPLKKLVLVSIPNGLLLSGHDGLLEKYPGLLYPGKDAKSKDPRKLRARVSFEKIKQIASWRYFEIDTL